MTVAGIILAAGASRRMGRPKALLEYAGETFLARLTRLLGEHCERVIVVGAPDSPYAVDVVNPEPERGMLSSLQCGLRALPPEAEAVLWTLVDLPAVSAATIAALAGARPGDRLRIPRFQGRRGHPVWMHRSLELELFTESESAKNVIRRHESETTYVDVDDPGVIMDADTPEEYLALSQRS